MHPENSFRISWDSGISVQKKDIFVCGQLASSHNFLSMIFGILGKFGIEIGEQIFFIDFFSSKFFCEHKKNREIFFEINFFQTKIIEKSMKKDYFPKNAQKLL